MDADVFFDVDEAKTTEMVEAMAFFKLLVAPVKVRNRENLSLSIIKYLYSEGECSCVLKTNIK